MRILLLNTSFPPQARSAARLFYELGVSLSETGHEVCVVTEFPWRRLGGDLKSSTIPEREKMEGMDIRRVRGAKFREDSILGRGFNLLTTPWQFYRAARSMGRFDAAIVYSPPLTLGLAAWMLKKRCGTPFIFNVQDIYPQTAVDLGYLKNPLLIQLLEKLERFTYRQAARVAVHSAGNQEYLSLQGRVEAKNTVAIPNWVDTDRVVPGNRLNEFRAQHNIGDRCLLCYAGTMGYAQDLTPIIEAAKAFQHRDSMVFLLAGEGVRAGEWREKTKALKNVQFLTLLAESEYAGLVTACDIGFVPLAENLRTPVVPAKLLDFMALARPIIATANPNSDIGAIIREAKCGFTFSPRQAAGVAEAICFLHDHPLSAQTMGASGRRYAERNFSRKTCAEKYEGLLREIVSGFVQIRKPETSRWSSDRRVSAEARLDEEVRP